MTDSSLAAISSLLAMASSSKDDAKKSIEQFSKIESTANSIYERLFGQQKGKEKPPC